MRLKSAVLIDALKVAVTQLRTTMSAAEYQGLKVKIESGNFLIFAEFLDNFVAEDGVGSADGAVLAFFKTLTNDAAAAENATRAFNKAATDGVSLSDADAITKQFNRPVADTAFVTDPISKLFSTGFADGISAAEDAASLEAGKGLSETPAAADQINTFAFDKGVNEAPVVADQVNTFAITKLLTDLVDATDDIDGTATTLDDQEVQFTKVTTNTATLADLLTLQVAYTRTFLDASGVTDDDVLNFGKRPFDTTSFTDAGSLRSQGYCDFTYFVEDYVGASRTFT